MDGIVSQPEFVICQDGIAFSRVGNHWQCFRFDGTEFIAAIFSLRPAMEQFDGAFC